MVISKKRHLVYYLCKREVAPCTSFWFFNLKAMDASRWLGLIGCRRPTAVGRLSGSMGAYRSRTNADDRLPRDPLGLDPLGRVQGGDGVVEGRDVADVRPQSSVPHPLDDLTQWVRSDSTTKSTDRPSAGRASVGPTMDTSVPPARIRPADRFWTSPPMTSNTRSTPPTSSSASLSRSTNSCAPKSSAF